jgi:alpha-tubulin suppressor-like RCC1 family protein
LTPVDVVGLSGRVIAVAAGGGHSCALMGTGGVKCWGYNRFGQVGDGTIGNRLTPVDVVGLSGGVTAIAAGGYHTCALMTTQVVKCWGANANG